MTSVYLEEFIWHNRSLYSLKLKAKKNHFSLLAILGIINSKLIQFYYQAKFKSEPEIFPKIRSVQVKEIPVPPADKIKVIDSFVKKILNSDNEVAIKFIEHQIDQIVYKLYNLTYEEACIVEGNNKWMSKEAYDKFNIK